MHTLLANVREEELIRLPDNSPTTVFALLAPGDEE